MNFRTIVARYPSKCRRCGGPVQPGDAIRWAPKRGTYHLKDYCGSDDLAVAAYEKPYGPIDAPAVDLSAPVPASVIGEVF